MSDWAAAAPDSYVARGIRYARAVIDGEIPAAELTRLACQRQLNDLARADRDADWHYVFDVEAASRICEFIELCPHIKGEWARRRELITLSDWQCWAMTTLFGWVHPTTRLRRFREAYLCVPRKNAKSTISAGIALYALAADGEMGAEIYTAATTREQARIVFDDARAMAAKSDDMRRSLGISVQQHRLVVLESVSKLEPLAAEGSTLDGLNPHVAILDELHAHKRRDVYDVIASAQGAREQPLLVCITTAGSDRAGICYERQTHLTKVLQGVIEDDALFGVIYTIDRDDDPFDPTCWAKANPNYGVSVKPDYIAAQARKAQAMPSAMNNFLTKHLNVWVNADSSWMDMKAWDACADASLRVEDFAGAECMSGLDLASKVDIASKCLLFERDDIVYLFWKHYLPERAVESGTNSQYNGWARQGWLTVTDGEVTDYDVIEDDIRADMHRHAVQAVGFDPFQATQLSGHMLDEDVPMVEIRPTVLNFSEPMKELEALVLQGKLRHNGDPVAAWAVSNVICHRDQKDNIYPRKERPENKIDPVVAALTALNRHLANPGDGYSSGFATLDD